MQEPLPYRLQHPTILVYLLGGILGALANLAVTILVDVVVGLGPLWGIFAGTLANQLLHFVYYSLVFANKEVRVKAGFGVQLLVFAVVAGAATVLLWGFLEMGFSFLAGFFLVLLILSVANSLLVRIATFGSGKLADVEYRDMEESFYRDQSTRAKVGWFRAWFHGSRFHHLNRFVHEYSRPGMQIVDLGCGNCLWNEDHLPVTGLDINEKMLGWARNHQYLHDYQICTNLASTGLPDRHADIVVMSETLEHLFDLADVLAEVRRILKDDGTFLITVPYDVFFGPFFVLFNINCVYQGYVKGSKYHRYRCGHINHFSKARLRSVLAAHGFQVAKLRIVNGLTLYAAARKS